jgi:RNase P subunit RPR2
MSLKAAFLKAGIKPSSDAKSQNVREKIAKKQVTETVIHQGQRNYCEACDQVKPDVEQYSHRNPTTDAEWICVRCADQLQIPDKFRKTAQSDTSIKKIFRREFGETIRIETSSAKSTGKPKGEVNGNR